MLDGLDSGITQVASTSAGAGTVHTCVRHARAFEAVEAVCMQPPASWHVSSERQSIKAAGHQSA
jgi:hypothetical protein